MLSRATQLLAAGLVTWIPAPSALAEAQSYLDVQASVGASTNPLLVTGSETRAALVRISGYAFHGWSSERSSTSLSAYLENSSYLRRYGNEQAFDLAATTKRELSEKVRLFGRVGFRGDTGGQLSSRFYGAPPESVITSPSVPDLQFEDPDLYVLNRRSYGLTGQVGVSAMLSPRELVTLSVGSQRLFLSGDNDDLSYTQYNGSVDYGRALSERVTLGARLNSEYSDYSGGRSITSVGPQATVAARLSSLWDLTMALGIMRTELNSPQFGSDRSTGLAVDGSLCRNVEFQRFCARIARRTVSSITGKAPTVTSASVDYYRRLSAKDHIQATASLARSGNVQILEDDQPSTYFNLAGSYGRRLDDRLTAGISVAARKLTSFGPNPRSDVSGSVFLRYRIGDVR